MLLTEKKFNYFDWGNPFSFITVIFSVISGFIFFSIVFGHIQKLLVGEQLSSGDIFSIIIFTFFLGLNIFIFLAFLISGKIKINDEGVEYKSWFKNAKIHWQDIQSIGVYVVSKNYNEAIELKKNNKFIFMGFKFLFVCVEDIGTSRPGLKISNELIFVQYRPEILDFMIAQMRLSNHPLLPYLEQNKPNTSSQAWRVTVLIILGLVTLFGLAKEVYKYNNRSKELFVLETTNIIVKQIKQIEQTEVLASPVGGLKKFQKYVKKNLIYPTSAFKNKIEGEVKLLVDIEKTGKIGYIRVLKGIGAGCDPETVRMMKEAPDWVPASNQNTPIAVKVEIIFDFSLSN